MGSSAAGGAPFRPRAIVIGGSAGAMDALTILLAPLPPETPWPIVVATHLHKSDDGLFAENLSVAIALTVREAEDKLAVAPGIVYVAPANYHLLIEWDGSLALSIDARERWARPSLDVLFESAARTWASDLVAVILSGASSDGAEGMKVVAGRGGVCLAQSPETATSELMPQAAIAAARITRVMTPQEIGAWLVDLAVGCTPEMNEVAGEQEAH